jgi:4-amino-4-deoxy-L-arabinose transferase-like glycosyltransferase
MVLLCCFAVAMVGVWMLPVLLAGFPPALSAHITHAKMFAETGIIPGGLTTLLLWFFSACIGWNDVICWTAVSAFYFALALLPWWWSVYRLFDARTAWVATVILSFFPIMWLEVVWLRGYSTAFLFLFFSFASFIELQKRNHIAAIILSGIFFGATLATKDAFITFIPWMLFLYVWLHRKNWKRGVLEAGLFGVLAWGIFVTPHLWNANQKNESLTLAFIAPLQSSLPGTGHLYPDDYTYEFDREAYDQIIRDRAQDASFLESQSDANYRRIFGVSDDGLLTLFLSDTWNFLNSIPALFLMDTMGGVFLWLFVIPGIAVTRKKHHVLLFACTGLWLTMEFLLRYVLHFSRDHLMDIGWVLALLAAVGVISVATSVQKDWKKVSVSFLIVLMTTAMALQLLQANRKQFARLYASSIVPESYSASAVVNALPEDAIVAYPRRPDLLFFAERSSVVLHEETIDRLSMIGKLQEPFDHYGVTHIIGYSDEQTRKILDASPRIESVHYEVESMPIQLTPFLKYLLHVIR